MTNYLINNEQVYYYKLISGYWQPEEIACTREGNDSQRNYILININKMTNTYNFYSSFLYNIVWIIKRSINWS